MDNFDILGKTIAEAIELLKTQSKNLVIHTINGVRQPPTYILRQSDVWVDVDGGQITFIHYNHGLSRI